MEKVQINLTKRWLIERANSRFDVPASGPDPLGHPSFLTTLLQYPFHTSYTLFHLTPLNTSSNPSISIDDRLRVSGILTSFNYPTIQPQLSHFSFLSSLPATPHPHHTTRQHGRHTSHIPLSRVPDLGLDPVADLKTMHTLLTRLKADRPRSKRH